MVPLTYSPGTGEDPKVFIKQLCRLISDGRQSGVPVSVRVQLPNGQFYPIPHVRTDAEEIAAVVNMYGIALRAAKKFKGPLVVESLPGEGSEELANRAFSELVRWRLPVVIKIRRPHGKHAPRSRQVTVNPDQSYNYLFRRVLLARR